MKILVIQLARLGDIYMSWPAMRALRRTHPDAEIHFLTRPRFEGAVEGLDAIDRHWSLSVSQILAPLVQNSPDVDASLAHLGSFVDELKSQNYDWVINLTFSPVSSYLTHAVSGLHSQVSGYSRYKDGTLCLPDDISSYFYSQVGTEKPNRVHVADVFASLLDLQYVESDWASPEIKANNFNLPERYLVVHVGASEQHKTLSAETWIQIIRQCGDKHASLPIVLIGAAHEAGVAKNITQALPQLKFIDLVGQTKISDLFSVIKTAELLIGGDSAPIHMASLTDTPTYNISVGTVNFWETGPKASLSFIYRVENPQAVSGERIGETISMLLNGELPPELITRAGGLVSYDRTENQTSQFQWNLVQAIYLGGPYPIAERMEILDGAMKLKDINAFASEQIACIPTKGLEFIGPLLDRAEEVIQTISQKVPELSPLVSWYQAEKIRVGPGSLEEICTAALNVHERLARHLQPYIPHEALTQEEVGDGTL